MSEPTSRQNSPLPALTEGEDALEREALFELNGVGLVELLDSDSRPTFVLDLDSDYLVFGDFQNDIRPIFCNAALRLHDQLLESVTGGDKNGAGKRTNNATYDDFRAWATGVTRFDDSRDVFPLTLLYRDMLWVGATIRKRWRIISGNQCYDTTHLPRGDLRQGSTSTRASGSRSPSSPHNTTLLTPKETTVTPTADTVVTSVPSSTRGSTLVSSEPPQLPKERSSATTGKVSDGASTTTTTTKSGAAVTLSSSPEHVVSDWTAAKPRGTLTEHMIFARNIDWSATPLGPMKSWSAQFREVANLVMQNPHPCSLFWGEELTMMYNEAYKNEVAGNKHPDLMGTGFSGRFSELWDGVASIFQQCARTGKSIRMENDRLPIER